LLRNPYKTNLNKYFNFKEVIFIFTTRYSLKSYPQL